MTTPFYKLKITMVRYGIQENLLLESGEVITKQEQAKAWIETEDLIKKSKESATVLLNLKQRLVPLKVETIWPRQIEPKTQSLINLCLAKIKQPGVRRFMQLVAAEREIQAALCADGRDGGSARQSTRSSELSSFTKHPKRMVERLQSAAQMASDQMSNRMDANSDVRDVVYAATLLEGRKELIKTQGLAGKGSYADGIVFCIVRSALHQLDESSPQQAKLLRQCLAWGNEDETSEEIAMLRKRISVCINQILSVTAC